MRTLVLGAGGIGGYFGGRLAEAGADVTFLVRPARAARLRTDGLVIASPLGDVTLDVEVVTTVDSPADLVILSCKAYDLPGAIDAIRPAVGPRTSVLPLLNGLAHLDALDAALGAERTLGGLATISVTMTADGTIQHLSPMSSVVFGARADGQRAACDDVAATLGMASFQAKRSPTIMNDLWDKFAFITAASGITGLMRANVGAIMAADDGERLTLALLDECTAIAAAAGYPLSRTMAAFATRILTTEAGFTASMLRDIEAGGRIEAEHIQGDMIRRGEALGLPTTLLRVVLCHLQAYEARRAASA